MADAASPLEFLEGLAATGLFEGQEEVLEQLRALAARGIHPMQILRPRAEEESMRPRMLESFDIEGIANYIAGKEVNKVVVMCGAGISTSAGIPDFRTPGSGLYDNLSKYNLPKPESIFELSFFRNNPSAFYHLAKEMWPGNFEPTPCHYFIKLLSEKGILLRCYSQNIDSLERQAGIPAAQIVAAHGNFDAAHVIDKDPEVEVPIEELKKAIDEGEEGWSALKNKYGGLVKPKITFFGESLPDRFMKLHGKDLKECDLLIVLGTSLVVRPFADLVGMANLSAPRLLVNRDAAGTVPMHDRGFRFELRGDQNWRDVFFQGDCDNGCFALASALGWRADLDALIDSKGTAPIARAPWAERPHDASAQ